ncbi:MAG TPA: sigma-54 dependent transcriptional regulator [Vicinamibacteria bacterium]|nr:sigma-54 dependent transcriptional regulator [Vicinamibacteria bacterium]
MTSRAGSAAGGSAGRRSLLPGEGDPLEKPTVLLVDDDDSTRGHLSVLLSGLGYGVAVSTAGDEAVSRLASGHLPALVMLDLVMPGMGGLDVLDHIKSTYPQIPVVILSSVGQIKTVVNAMNRGASDYLVKPVQEAELTITLESALEKQRLRDEVRVLRRRLDQFDPAEFLSSSPQMLRLKEIARQVAETDAPVLVLGETGVGKELLVRYIHEQSPRRDKPFVKVNCAALPHDLLESELFGYERGAFSGAVRDKPGKFELAHKGSILLDEIAEMSPHVQAKLLHVLQDGEYSRLGARHSSRVDSRVFASTNIPLERAVAEGKFRQDLYFRVNVIRMEVPPLRERPEDIPLLANAFLRRYLERYSSPTREFPPELAEAFRRHSWPGNVRELDNAVRRFAILPDVNMALAELSKTRAEAPEAPPREDVSLKTIASQAAEKAEQEIVRRALAETRWNRREAARRLRISYKALLNKIKKWQLEAEVPLASPPGAAAAKGTRGAE